MTLAAGAFFLFAFTVNAYAAKPAAKTPAPVQQPARRPPVSSAESEKLRKCLKRADDMPDIAAAEAQAWIKQGGGSEAQLCRAFAQANRGMHADAAREFWALAALFKKHDARRAADMDALAGQEFLRARDAKNAEARFGEAMKLAPGDPADYIGRAEARMQAEKYWDAIDDLNRALKLDAKNVDALRQRGRAWIELGNEKNAQEDFEQAADLSGESAPPDEPEKP